MFRLYHERIGKIFVVGFQKDFSVRRCYHPSAHAPGGKLIYCLPHPPPVDSIKGSGPSRLRIDAGRAGPYNADIH